MKKYAIVIHDNDVQDSYEIIYRLTDKDKALAMYKAHKNKNEPIELIEYEVKKSKHKVNRNES